MIRHIASLSLAAFLAGPALAKPPELFATYCARCHGAERLGAIGPALIPETLGRMRGPDLAQVIAEGRPATRMPGFAGDAGRGRDRRPRRLARNPARGGAPVGRGGDRRFAGARSRLPPRRGPGLRRRPDEPLRRGRDRRPPRQRARRRPLRGDRPLPYAHRGARRPQVLARRPLRLRDVARRLGAEVRPLVARRGRPGARRPQQPQHRHLEGRQVARRRQLPARDPDDPRRRRPLGRPRHRGDGARRHAVARVGRLPGPGALELYPRAQGRPEIWEIATDPEAPPVHAGWSTATRPAWRRRSGPPAASSPCGASPSPSRSTTSSSRPTTRT